MVLASRYTRSIEQKRGSREIDSKIHEQLIFDKGEKAFSSEVIVFLTTNCDKNWIALKKKNYNIYLEIKVVHKLSVKSKL